MNEPEITGRFNYSTFRKNLFDVIFAPFRDTTRIVVARNLTFDEKEELMRTLNAALDTSRGGFYEDATEEGR